MNCSTPIYVEICHEYEEICRKYEEYEWASLFFTLHSSKNYGGNNTPCIIITGQRMTFPGINTASINHTNTYRKLTFSGKSICVSSLLLSYHKMATINMCFHRLLKLKLTQAEYNVEIEKITPSMDSIVNIKAMVKRKNLKNLLAETRTSQNTYLIPSSPRKRWVKFPYLGPLIKKQVINEVRQYGYVIGFYSLARSIHLFNNKDPVPKKQLYRCIQDSVWRSRCKKYHIG